MVNKKRGGRRGKASTAPEDQPSQPETGPKAPPSKPEAPPSTSQAVSPQKQPILEASEKREPVWGRGRPIKQEERAPRAQAHPTSAWGRGRGRGKTPPETKPGPAGEQGWGGAKPKEREQPSSVRTPLETKPEQVWGGSKPKGGAMQLLGGTRGRKIRIETNHIRLNLGTLTVVYRYDVSIQPERKPKWMTRAAMQLFQRAYFPHNNPSYDGQKLLYSAKRLPLTDDTINGTVTVALEGDRTQEFHVTVKLTGTLDLSPLHNLLQKKNIGQEEAFQCVEVVFRQAYTSSFISVGRRFYTRPTRNDYPLGTGAQMYLGGYQAAVKGCVPFLNVDVAHKAFTTATPVKNLIIDMFSSRNRPIVLENFNLQRWQSDQMSDYLKGLKVIYQIPNHPGSKKVYKVNGLANIPSHEMFQQDGQTLSVEEYFRTRWHCTLQSNLPTLWVGTTGRICVPMEYCTLKEGQALDGSRMTGTQTSEMIKYSATSTTERKKKIQNILEKAGQNTNPCIKEFGFSIGNQFECLDARVLDPPELEYADGTVEPKKGVWYGRKFKKGAKIEKWTIVGLGVRREWVGTSLSTLAKMILDFGQSSGMIVSKAEEPFEFIRDDVRSLTDFLEKKKTHDLIIVVIPNNKDSYFLVKQVSELKIGCLTQCIKSDTLNKLNQSTVSNILLKINTKMNGTSHTIHNLGLITDEPCMVMGADVTHPSPHARSIPSVVAVTASYDLTATNYSISVYLQKPRTTMSEIVQKLETITLEKLRMFVQKTRKEPARIYFLRDGVSDGEFERVKENEVKAIERGCDTFRRGYKPKITFLVVQKRHHTRFFPLDQKSSAGDKNFNAPVGTCVDTVITDPHMQNFYLLSHQSIKGVGRPTKYWTLHDDNGLSNDDVQVLTYYLCHVYSRCNRAVSYPAPTYYAHLAADRAKGYLHKKNIDLENLDQKLVQINGNFAVRNPMFFS